MSADAIAAIATATGVLVALGFGVVSERRTYRDRNELAETRKRSQASQVAAWIETVPVSAHSAKAQLVVQNASDQPVWNVVVAYWSIGDEGPDGLLEEHGEEWRLGLLPPETVRRRDAPWTAPEDAEPTGVSFRDNANNWWLRSEVGYLLPLSGDPHGAEEG